MIRQDYLIMLRFDNKSEEAKLSKVGHDGDDSSTRSTMCCIGTFGTCKPMFVLFDAACYFLNKSNTNPVKTKYGSRRQVLVIRKV